MTWWLRGFLMNIIADTEFLDKTEMEGIYR